MIPGIDVRNRLFEEELSEGEVVDDSESYSYNERLANLNKVLDLRIEASSKEAKTAFGSKM